MASCGNIGRRFSERRGAKSCGLRSNQSRDERKTINARTGPRGAGGMAKSASSIDRRRNGWESSAVRQITPQSPPSSTLCFLRCQLPANARLHRCERQGAKQWEPTGSCDDPNGRIGRPTSTRRMAVAGLERCQPSGWGPRTLGRESARCEWMGNRVIALCVGTKEGREGRLSASPVGGEAPACHQRRWGLCRLGLSRHTRPVPQEKTGWPLTHPSLNLLQVPSAIASPRSHSESRTIA